MKKRFFQLLSTFKGITKLETSQGDETVVLGDSTYQKSILKSEIGQSASSVVGEIRATGENAVSALRQQTDVRQASKFLAEELRRYMKQEHKVAGSGYCRSCESCAAESCEAGCRKPLERIFSLEAMVVDVSVLLKQSFGFGLGGTGDQTGYITCVWREPSSMTKTRVL